MHGGQQYAKFVHTDFLIGMIVSKKSFAAHDSPIGLTLMFTYVVGHHILHCDSEHSWDQRLVTRQV